jgi:hypothetical protein
MWSLELLNDNIALLLATIPYWMMLSLVILGPKAILKWYFDVFLEPLLDELLKLWGPGM